MKAKQSWKVTPPALKERSFATQSDALSPRPRKSGGAIGSLGGLSFSRPQSLRELAPPLPDHKSAEVEEEVERAERRHSFRTASAPLGDMDPLAMVWGAGHWLAQSSELMTLNKSLRGRLEEETHRATTLQGALNDSRVMVSALTTQVEELRRDLSSVMRERDGEHHRCSSLEAQLIQSEHTLRSFSQEKERVMFGLESQLTDLRARLLLLSEKLDVSLADTRMAQTEAKEASGRCGVLQSKLSLAESSCATQRQANENLVVEMRLLNQQLREERRKNLSLISATQAAATRHDEDTRKLSQLEELKHQRDAAEREINTLLTTLSSCYAKAADATRAEMNDALAEANSASSKWESVAQLLYIDVRRRTTAHTKCREEVDVAKAKRDAVEVALRQTQQRFDLFAAKLEAIWPTHEDDAPEAADRHVLEALFRKRQIGTFDSLAGTQGEGDNIIVQELRCANKALLAELEQAKQMIEALSEHVNVSKVQRNTDVSAAQSEAKVATARAVAAHNTVTRQADHIALLEQQLSALRGNSSSSLSASNVSLVDLRADENVIELFVGRLTVPLLPAHEIPPQLFATIDFLVHEIITSDVVVGTGFLDVSCSFKVVEDALLLHYFRTRELRIQLYQLVTDVSCGFCPVAEGSISLMPLSEDALRCTDRPQMRGEIALLNSSHAVFATVEYNITLRSALSANFIRLCESSAIDVDKPNPSATLDAWASAVDQRYSQLVIYVSTLRFASSTEVDDLRSFDLLFLPDGLTPQFVYSSTRDLHYEVHYNASTTFLLPSAQGGIRGLVKSALPTFFFVSGEVAHCAIAIFDSWLQMQPSTSVRLPFQDTSGHVLGTIDMTLTFVESESSSRASLGVELMTAALS